MRKLKRKIIGKKRKILFAGLFIFSPLTIKPISNTIQPNRDSIEIMIPRGGGEIIYKFKEHPKLIREIVKLDSSTQTELNNLIQDLFSNNLNSEIQIEPVNDLKNVFKVSSSTQATVFSENKMIL